MKIKLPQIKIKKKKQEPVQSNDAVFDLSGGSAPVQFQAAPAAAAPSLGADEDAFAVNVRNDEPMIRLLDDGKKEKFPLLQDLQLNLATAAVMMSMLAMLFTAADAADLIFFAIPGFIVFMLFATLDTFEGEKFRRIRMYAAAAGLIALLAALIIFRKYIGNGWGIIMNQLYDEGELAQAYIYDRFNIGSLGDEHPYRCMHFAAIWGSCLLGLITSFPPARYRRTVGILLAGISMLAFAYYGLIPSWICIAVMLAALLFLMADGSILSSAAIMLALIIIFGAITLIDPGENYGISRMDENFRDRFALRSSYLDGGDLSNQDLDNLSPEEQERQDRMNNGGSQFIAEHKILFVLIVVLLILAALGAGAWLFMKRLKKRQAENRAGIDRTDPREAIVAMFPYSVKWLQPAGIDPVGKNFASLIPVINADLSVQYAKKYSDMYEVWKEAAYSDHDINAEKMYEMKAFLGDTIAMVKEKSDFRTRCINTIKYAL